MPGEASTTLPLPVLRNLAGELQDLGAVMVTLTGGEPLLREDLPEILRSFDSRSCLVLGTTGEGLTAERARTFRDSGLFAVGISLDSDQEAEHDRLRGRAGAFRSALQALRVARETGLYPYVVSVATREFLQRSRFMPFLRIRLGGRRAGGAPARTERHRETGRANRGAADGGGTATDLRLPGRGGAASGSPDPFLVCLPGIAGGLRLRRRSDSPLH